MHASPKYVMYLFLAFVVNLKSTMYAGSRSGASHNVVLSSQSSTPRITPPGSPPSRSALVSPTRTSSKPVSPRRHAMSFSTSRGMFDDRSSAASQTGHSLQIIAFLAYVPPLFSLRFF